MANVENVYKTTEQLSSEVSNVMEDFFNILEAVYTCPACMMNKDNALDKIMIFYRDNIRNKYPN